MESWRISPGVFWTFLAAGTVVAGRLLPGAAGLHLADRLRRARRARRHRRHLDLGQLPPGARPDLSRACSSSPSGSRWSPPRFAWSSASRWRWRSASPRPGVKPLLLMLVILPFWTNLLIRTYAHDRRPARPGLRQLGARMAVGWRPSSLLTPIGLAGLMGERFQPLDLLYNNTAVIFGIVYIYLPFMVLPLYATLGAARPQLSGSQPRPGRRRSVRTCSGGDRAAGPAGHRLRRHPGLHPGTRHLPDLRPPGRARQPADRQRHRAPVQGGQQPAARVRPCRSSCSTHLHRLALARLARRAREAAHG